MRGVPRAPVTVLVVELAGVALLPNNLDLPEGIAILIAAYSAARYSERRLLVDGLLVATAAGLLAFGDRTQIPTGRDRRRRRAHALRVANDVRRARRS